MTAGSSSIRSKLCDDGDDESTSDLTGLPVLLGPVPDDDVVEDVDLLRLSRPGAPAPGCEPREKLRLDVWL